MKRILFFFAAIASLAGAFGFGGAGGCGGGTQVTTVGATLTLPNDIRDVADYQVSLVLLDKLDNMTVFGPQAMVFNPDHGRWEVEVEGLEGDYVGTIDIIVTAIDGDVPIARASKSLTILKGTDDVTFDYNAVSFDLDLNNDGVNDAESLPL